MGGMYALASRHCGYHPSAQRDDPLLLLIYCCIADHTDIMHSLALFITQFSINTLIWIVSVALELWLIVALFSRGVARRHPVFTALIGFYLVRSVLLYVVFNHIALNTYHTLYDDLQIVDLSLQAAVAIEIAIHLIRNQTGRWRQSIAPVALLALAILCTALATTLLPAHAPIPADRAQLFFSFLMILLFAWSQTIPATLTRNIAAGFALYGIADLSASFGRTYAALHANAPAYALWSYAVAGIYIVVVAYWLVTLRRQPEKVAA